jgi:hypothetical protein
MKCVRKSFLLFFCVGCASGNAALPSTSSTSVESERPEEPRPSAPVDSGSPQPADGLKGTCKIEEPERCSQLCEMSDASACYVGGLGFQKRPPETRDDRRSLALYQRGCDLGSMEACGNLGLMFEKG